MCIGLPMQVIEAGLGFARPPGISRARLLPLLTPLVVGAAGAALTFGTTYALGQVAKSYYASGRKMSVEQLKSVFSQQSAAAEGLYQRVAPQVQQQASSLSAGGLARLLPSLK